MCARRSSHTQGRSLPALRSRLLSAILLLSVLCGPTTPIWTQNGQPSANDSIERLSESLSVLESRARELAQRLSVRDSQVSELESQLSQLQSELSEARNELEKAERELDKSQTELQETSNSLARLEQRLSELESSSDRLLAEKERQILDLEDERDAEARRARAERWRGRLEGSAILVAVATVIMLFSNYSD